MNLSNIPEKIFDLLVSRSFDELNVEEKELVLESFTKEEYHTLHEGVQEFMKADKLITPVMANPVGTSDSKRRFGKIANYPVPLYQVAAGILLLLGIYFLMPENRSGNTIDLTVVRDTIQTGTPLSADRYPDKLIYHP